MKLNNDWIALLIGIPVIGFLVWLFLSDETLDNFELNISSGASNKDWVSAVTSAFPTVSNEGINGINKIVKAFNKWGDGDTNKLAYILATAWHESRLKPVRECFATSDQAARNCVEGRSYGIIVNDHVYYGRGYPQLTWESNYIKMGNNLGYDLVNNPDKALDSLISAEILNYGMINGSFTTKKLDTYINSSGVDFHNARRTVNGTDKAAMIADYAISILNNYHLF